MLEALAVLLAALAWVGHAYILTAALNNLYGRALPKTFLKPLRYLAGLAILAFPLLLWSAVNPDYFRTADASPVLLNGAWGYAVAAYGLACLYFGFVFPMVTLERYLRKPPACVLSESTRTLDLWPEYGEKLVGDGIARWLTRIPGNCVFRLDITELTLALPKLPPEWDGLTLLVVSDVHFHGTPSRVYFDRVFDEIAAGPEPDLVCLIGDYLDSDRHYEWVGALFGRLRAKEAKLAILGNHDEYHDPDRVRAELAAAGYTVLGNRWEEIAIRGVPCVVVGHEGPWINPPPDLGGAPGGPFRLCLSHTPDNFYWGRANGVGLMLCGHVHGGGIRVPLVGSIFVPSVYGRRFDHGVFEEGGAVMAVNRGVSGKEPIRVRCHPQVFRITLKAAPPAAN
jgi:predicted MPP superfamily phosphohydrolase